MFNFYVISRTNKKRPSFSISVSGKWKKFTFKICQTAAGFSITSQFHRYFFQFNFWRVFVTCFNSEAELHRVSIHQFSGWPLPDFDSSSKNCKYGKSFSCLCIHEFTKVIHPKYYKHLKKGAHQRHLGRQKMGWFLADQPVHQVKLKY